jgi:hypothetical protein
MTPGESENDSRLRQSIARLVFITAALFTTILVIMGVTGVHWPKWLLALTTIL